MRWGSVVALLIIAAITIKLLPILQSWVSMHDRNPGMGQFLLPTKRANGPKQALLLLGVSREPDAARRPGRCGRGLPSVAAARPHPRRFPGVAGAVSHGVHRARLDPDAGLDVLFLPAAPVFYVAAGVFLDYLTRVDWKLRLEWLMPATILLAMLTSGAPTLVSQSRNGRRFEFRTVAQWLEPQLARGDVVYSDQRMVMAHI